MEPAHDGQFFLSVQPAGPGERKFALGALTISVAVFLVCAPFAKLPLAPVPAFIPAYEASLVITDLITAVLLLGSFGYLRSPSLLVLAGGYTYSALMTVCHALTFPGLFAPGGLLGAGPQSTAWLYMFWHGGFPLFVIGYAVLKRRERQAPRAAPVRPWLPLLGGLGVVSAVLSLTVLATAGHDWLPEVMQGNAYTPAMLSVVSGVWGCSLAALAVLWWRKPHTFLDLWLIVVMCAWLFDIALAAGLNGGRFDLGFYAGRLYGFMATSTVLVAQLLETSMLYGRLARAHEGEQWERQRAQEARLAADEANRAKSAFLANLSHELRTPLNAILGYSELIVEELKVSPPANLSADLKKIHGAGLHLLALIGKVLDLSKIEAGRMDLFVEPFHLGEALGEVIATTAHLIEKNGNRLESCVPADSGPFRCDVTKLKQILLNLISNAAKFTRQGTIRFSVNVEVLADGRRVLSCAVSDTGIGLTPEQVGKLFQPFSQADRSTARLYGGTGLGLAITKVYCELLGGTIGVSSEFGRGTTFHVRIPVETDAQARAAEEFRPTAFGLP